MHPHRTIPPYVSLLPLLCVFVSGAVSASEVHDAAEAGDMVRLQAVLKAHPEMLDARDKNGRTALNIAAAAGNLEMAEALMISGADVNAKDNAGQTPLSRAQAAHHDDVAKSLKSHGADAIDFSKVNDSVVGAGTWCAFAAVALFGLGLFFMILRRKKRSPEDLLADEMNDQP